jgi:branched-chain amino acid transport system substrate-binding protein
LAILGVGGCETQEPLRIGFAGTLSGKAAILGTAGRDGVLLAIEECNRQGGVNGRKVELLIKDDGNEAEQAKKVDQELINAGVSAIIGHMSSEMTAAAYETVMASGLVLLSPTVSSVDFSGRDDNFFRVAGTSDAVTSALANHCSAQRGWKQAAIIYDLANKSYSLSYADLFKRAFVATGGRITRKVSFTAGPGDISMKEIAARALEESPDGVLVIAASLDAAILCQQLKRINPGISLASSGWAFTEELVQNGGKAVEGIVFPSYYQPDSPETAFVAFAKSFGQRFGYQSSFAASLGYEAATVVLAGLKEASSPRQLKKTLLRMQRFPGLRGDLVFDRFGDIQRPFTLLTVKDGRFSTVQ